MVTNVITRFPPSPTGLFHVGSARTALFNYLFAKHHKGTFLLRFEDTDKERSKPEFEESILEGIAWLGIHADNKEIPRQSEQTEHYIKALEDLIASGHAYEAEASEKGEGKVVRFKNPNTTIAFSDEVRGEITFNTTELGDFVIARSLHEPLYHLSVVVDDIESGVTHLIRGEDHISNTPRQILILEALGAPRPTYAHLPLILNADRTKMSKRTGATDVKTYQEGGYLPEAFVNFLAFLGWNPGTEQEFFSMEELITAFELKKVQKGGAVFDIQKLKSINRHYLKNLSVDALVEALVVHIPDVCKEMPQYSKETLKKLVPILIERIDVPRDVETIAKAGELDYFFMQPTLDPEKLLWKGETSATTKEHLSWIVDTLTTAPSDAFSADGVKALLWDYASEKGRGAVLWPLRCALSGLEKSPDPFTLAAFFGKEETIVRIKYAQEIL